MLKSINCGELRSEHTGQTVTLAGWVHRRRDHGALLFLDLRDRSGIVQVTCDAQAASVAHAVLNAARSEYVIQVTGIVQARPAGLTNPNLPTGEIEVVAAAAQILNEARTTPFYINEDADVDEALRLKYRYLDLRRPAMQRNILLRHHTVKLIRDFMTDQGFIEIETPMLIKTTPEGARDYVVPSRVHPGQFYALPQSPQQLKQLLMVAGYERYFQIARCFRDEDLRADRQPEFTQLDVEMSFVEREDVMGIIEPLYTRIIETLGSKPILQKPFPVLTYAEAMDKYGSDKPDLRFGMQFVDLSDLLAESAFQVCAGAVAAGGQVKAIVAPGAAAFSRKQLDDLAEVARRLGAKGLIWIACRDGGVKTSAKALNESELAAIIARTGAADGDLILIVADSQRSVVAKSLGELRLSLGNNWAWCELASTRCAGWWSSPCWSGVQTSSAGQLCMTHSLRPWMRTGPCWTAILARAGQGVRSGDGRLGGGRRQHSYSPPRPAASYVPRARHRPGRGRREVRPSVGGVRVRRAASRRPCHRHRSHRRHLGGYVQHPGRDCFSEDRIGHRHDVPFAVRDQRGPVARAAPGGC